MPAPDVGKPEPLTARTFRFSCRRCHSVLEARSTQCGQRGTCPSCAAAFTIPDLDASTGLARTDADPGADGELPAPVHAYAAAGVNAPRIVRDDIGNLSIECPRCKSHSAITADNCPECGLPFTIEGAIGQVRTADSISGAPALLLGAVALPLSFCPLVGFFPAVWAIVLAIKTLSRPNAPFSVSAAFALAMGVLACILSTLVLLKM